MSYTVILCILSSLYVSVCVLKYFLEHVYLLTV